MSRQCYVYLLPDDVESLVQRLKSKLGATIMQPSSPRPSPIILESAICKQALMLKEGAVRVDCYIAPSNADIKMRNLSGSPEWRIQETSEVIEFQGCEFDGKVLLRGRFYLQNDFVVEEMLAPKKAQFIAWAGRVFRLVKNSLRRSEALNVYIGEHAERWRRNGGRFAWMVTRERGPIFETEAES